MSIQTFKKMMTGSVILVSTVLLTACASTSATTVSEGHHSDSVRSSRKSDVKVPTRTSNVTMVSPATTSSSSDQSSLAVTGTSSSASDTSAVSDSNTTSSNVSVASTSSAQTSSVQSGVVPSSSVQNSSVQSNSTQSSSVKGNATQTSLSKVASGTVATSGQQDSSSQQVSQVTGNVNGQSSVSSTSKTNSETTQQSISSSNSSTKSSSTNVTSTNGILSNFRSQMGYNETNGSRQYTVISNGNGTYQIDVRTQAPDANISNLSGVYTYTPANKEVTTVFSGADAGNGEANTVNTPTTDNSTSATQSNH
ncbi:hypothetical protein [Furfurilactobacillus rossiae]|uniref:Uncharacterized protein n=1 Tax=Furfurilactobacillus rossiae DSM 15814 TaxID=1114972 RepID=A0A0R1RF70_9LACO|nr:hypothetical protein [Furfurilactobacillus rossiae]KRL55001.1 hypothetical protein FD35_GL002454 [Furfurilactobacillus rossiae DSM 15814]QFR67777.1 hypothetical protein LR814_11965 [Furfurilactobacillus rossiae]QLE60752.1 Cell wall mannoprotein of the Srp1p-Tip1p serine-alanine-rich proteins [Furfurilactobacillus rossiae]